MPTEVEMNDASREAVKSLEHHAVARVDVTADNRVELAIPDSKGWRLVISATVDEGATPTLVACWEPGLRQPHRHRAGVRRLLARQRRWGSVNRARRILQPTRTLPQRNRAHR
jgi:hypothetical protein